MICKNCGFQAPDGVGFCPQCGVTLELMPVTIEPKVNKQKFLATKARPGIKKTAKLSTIVMIVAALLLVASYFVTLNIPMFDIPVVSPALSSTDADTDELTDELERAYEDLEEVYDQEEDNLSEDAQKELKKFVKATEKVVDNFSISNFESFVKVAADMDPDVIGEARVQEFEDVADEMGQVMSVVKTVMIIFYLIPLMFILLAGWRKNLALAIIAVITSIISQAILTGMLMLVVTLLVNVYQCILCSNIGKAYRKYRDGV